MTNGGFYVKTPNFENVPEHFISLFSELVTKCFELYFLYYNSIPIILHNVLIQIDGVLYKEVG